MSQIPLTGVVSVQNSKVNTGETVYVPNTQVSSQNAQPNTTDNEGKFTLRFTGVASGRQVQIAVTLYGAYKDYVVVNEKELQSITLGRITPVSVYICRKGDLEQRQAEMVGLNMRKLEERMEADKKRLQKERDLLRQNNDYLTARYSEIKDSLDVIDKNIDNAFERIKEYAKNMVLENLDDKDDNYVKAYHCFSRGELDSVSYYLQDHELELKYQKILQLREDLVKEQTLAKILTESAKVKEEYSKNSLSELIKEWLLLARTYNMKNNYEKTMTYYEKAIHADTLITENLFEFATYLYSIREYAKAEKYYLQCLERYRILEQENPEEYLADVAQTLNDLAILHWSFREYSKALEKLEEALDIRRKLAVEDPKNYLAGVAQTLNNLGILHWMTKEYRKAAQEYEEALEIRRDLAAENPTGYLDKVALTLMNFAILHKATDEYFKALEEYEEALEIYRDLAAENPKTFLSNLASCLDNLANLHELMKEYPKALEEYEEALEIRRTLAAENPKAYLVSVAETLRNLADLYKNTGNFSKSLEKLEEALEIYRQFAAENPKAYSSIVTEIEERKADMERK